MKKKAESFAFVSGKFYICGVKVMNWMKREIRVITGMTVREVVDGANAIGVMEVIGLYEIGGGIMMLYWWDVGGE